MKCWYTINYVLYNSPILLYIIVDSILLYKVIFVLLGRLWSTQINQSSFDYTRVTYDLFPSPVIDLILKSIYVPEVSLTISLDNNARVHLYRFRLSCPICCLLLRRHFWRRLIEEVSLNNGSHNDKKAIGRKVFRKILMRATWQNNVH